jgi:hypothetical protein
MRCPGAFIGLASGIVLAAVAVLPAAAAPSITEAFLANAKQNIRFLQESGRLAAARDQGADVQAYAQDTSKSEAAAEAELDQALTPRVADAGMVDPITSGRSAAEPGLGQAANGRMPPGRTELATLSAKNGRAFLDEFWLYQLDALSQLRADYTAYAERGDNPALVAWAKRQLPEVERRLAALCKI